MVVTISPSFNLYRIVVLPAASNPTIKILISFLPQSDENNCENDTPIFEDVLVYFKFNILLARDLIGTFKDVGESLSSRQGR